jgi:flagellar biosynthetic protein FliO
VAVLLPQFIIPQTPENSGPAASSPEASLEAVPEVAPPPDIPAAEDSRTGEESFLFSDTPPGALSASPPVFAILRMILVLALVAVFIYLAVFFLRRLSRPQGEQNPHLKILASTHLGSGRFLYVVSIGTQTWLVGAGEGGINHIADLQDREIVDAMILEASKRSAEMPGPGALPAFQALLKKFSGGTGGREQDRLENIRRRRERFKRF